MNNNFGVDCVLSVCDPVCHYIDITIFLAVYDIDQTVERNIGDAGKMDTRLCPF